MSGWTTATSFRRLEQACTVLLPIITCLIMWGRYNILAIIFFVSFSFLCTKYLIAVFLPNKRLQKRMSAIVCMFAPALSPLVTFTCSLISNKDPAACNNMHKDSFCNGAPHVGHEIDTLVEHIVHDYILFWFRAVSPDDEDFVNECRQAFKNMFTTFVKEKLVKVRADRLMPKALAAVRNHVQLNGSSVRRERVPTDAQEEAIALTNSIAEYLLTSCAPAALNRMNEPVGQQHASGHVQRDSVFIMVKEMLAFGVLMPIAFHLSDPKLIFRSIIGVVSDTGVGKRDPESEAVLSSLLNGTDEDAKKWPSDPEKRVALLSDPLSDPQHFLLPFDPDPKSHGSGHVAEYGELPSPNTRLSLDADTGLEKGLEVGEEADQRLFHGIRVSDTKISGVKGDYYVEYRVTYDGLFEMLESVASSKTTVSCLVRQEVSVWRRFSEFVALHQELDGNQILRPFLKRIENPIRLKTVTSIFGSKLARHITIQRRMFLVRYLSKLAEIPLISNSPPFRLFLAYDSDVSGKADKSGSSKTSVLKSLVPARLDRVITEGIRGAVTIIRNVIPIESYQDGYFTFFSSQSERAKIDTRFGNDLMISSLLSPQSTETIVRGSSDSSPYFRQESHLSTNFSMNAAGDDLKVQSNNKDQNNIQHHCMRGASDCKTSEVLFELFELIRSEGKTSNHSVPLYILKSLFGDFLETILQQVVNFHWNEETFVLLLHSLHKSIWSVADVTPCEQEATSEMAAQVIENWIKSKPFYCRFLPLDLGVFFRFAMSSLHSHQENQILIYELINVIFVHLRDEC